MYRIKYTKRGILMCGIVVVSINGACRISEALLISVAYLGVKASYYYSKKGVLVSSLVR